MTSLKQRPEPKLDTPRAKNLALILLAMTQFVVVIDAAIVNVALPSIGTHLHFSRDDLSWVVNAYTLTFGGFLLLGGRLADLLGRRRMFMGGLVLFSIASFAGGIAQSEPWLITARAVQGLGAASSPRPPCRSSPRPSGKGPNGTARSGSGAPSPAPEARRACSSAES